MSTKIRFQAEGYHTVTPHMIFKSAASALDFYKQAFGAAEIMRMAGPGGKIMHAEMRIGDSIVMMADEFPEMGALSPQTVGGSPMSLMIYVENVDASFGRAISAGAKVCKPLQDQFYGDRSGTINDPFGYQWTLATHVEDVSPEEMKKRMAAMAGPG